MSVADTELGLVGVSPKQLSRTEKRERRACQCQSCCCYVVRSYGGENTNQPERGESNESMRMMMMLVSGVK